MTGYTRAHLSELPSLPPPDGTASDWRPIRRHFGIQAFGVNAWIGHSAGDQVIEEHDELPGDDGLSGHEELYLVTRGTARFRVGDDEFVAPPGTLVHLADPALIRSARALEPGTTVIAIGAAPGEPFRVSPWEQRQAQQVG